MPDPLRLEPVPEGKHCSRCGNVKPLAEYTGNSGRCRECRLWKGREVNYGLTRRAFEVMLAGQGGRCAICRTDDPPVPPKHIDGWNVDHNHETGAVRGILCHHCNVRLAVIEDVDFADAARAYLDERETDTARYTDADVRHLLKAVKQDD